jgi:magnesium transporter
MLNAFSYSEGRFTAVALEPGETPPPSVVWIDLFEPTPEERQLVSMHIAAPLPSEEAQEEIEESSRLYVLDGIWYLTTNTFAKVETSEGEVGPFTFIVTRSCLVTLRHLQPRFLVTAQARLTRMPGPQTPEDIMIVLLDSLIDRTADVLENIATHLDDVSHEVFAMVGPEAQEIRHRRRQAKLNQLLLDIGQAGERIGRIRAALAAHKRLLTYLRSADIGKMSKQQDAKIKSLSRDVDSIELQGDFLSDRVDFLLSATLGVISAQQNDIVRIFSVAAVGFLPPTLVASIYGMNFKHMPELEWYFGYPLAVLLMVLSAVLPLWYFRRKGWL